MRLRHLGLTLLAAALVLAWLSPAQAKGTAIHFFVIPQIKSGGEAFLKETVEFKKKLVQLAGGFTQLGNSEGGSMQDDGTVKQQMNVSFIVAADKDISGPLADLIRSCFKVKSPFILVWQGTWPRR